MKIRLGFHPVNEAAHIPSLSDVICVTLYHVHSYEKLSIVNHIARETLYFSSLAAKQPSKFVQINPPIC